MLDSSSNAAAPDYGRFNITLKPEYSAVVAEAIQILYGRRYADQITSRERNIFTRILLLSAARAVAEFGGKPSLPLALEVSPEANPPRPHTATPDCGSTVLEKVVISITAAERVALHNYQRRNRCVTPDTAQAAQLFFVTSLLLQESFTKQLDQLVRYLTDEGLEANTETIRRMAFTKFNRA